MKKRIPNSIPATVPVTSTVVSPSPAILGGSATDGCATTPHPSIPADYRDYTANLTARLNRVSGDHPATPRGTIPCSDLLSVYNEAINLAHTLDKAYWNDISPLVSDTIYDALVFAVSAFETKHGYEAQDSPSHYVGLAPANGRRQVLRRTTMLSTQKAQKISDVVKWVNTTRDKIYGPTSHIFNLEWKFDGVSLSLVYVNGVLTEASEGKGAQGNDVMKHCRYITGIPQRIPALASEPRIEVRGEVVMPFVLLEKTAYKNCRSAAAGIMANGASTPDECSLLCFYPWWVDGMDLSVRMKNSPFVHYDSQAAHLYALTELGFLNAEVTTIGQVSTTYELEEELKSANTNRSYVSFPTDGVVVKVISKSLWNQLGQTEHHPKCMIAYKFPAATVMTTVRRIEITIGEKTGKRTPVAYFDPVVINGATYQKCSIGSEAKLKELGIFVGSRVQVSLRNDVIPHIDKVI